jgi:outer membrane protein assembly factor BamB
MLMAAFPALGGDWPQFRGPDGQGHSSERRLPLTWSETENIVWKVPVDGRGWSSPVLKEGQIWLTTADPEGHFLRAVCLDRETGVKRLEVDVFRKEAPGRINGKNSHASPTPILEGERVYVHYGAHGTACLSNDGEIIWKTVLEYNHGHGPAGCPVLFEDMLIISCDGRREQFVVALEKHTGEIRWRSDRPEGRHAYSTPLVIQVDGRSQLVSTGGDRVVAYDPLTGEEIWWSRYVGYSLVPRPVYGHGLVFVCSGFDPPATLYAIRPDGREDVTDSHIAWTLNRGVPLTPSPLLVGDDLFIVSDDGIATCLDAKTGTRHWRRRIEGNFSASPVYTAGRIYLLSEEGVTTVIGADRSFEELATNRLDGRTLASIAVSSGAIYLRSETHLYRIQSLASR